jgi:glycosyltransferase involved in cell wall biosynthesis
VRRWLQANEWIGGKIANHLIADHPGIAKHLSRHTKSEKITMIPYGADRVDGANEDLLREFGLVPRRYALIIGRAEPENSILEMVRAFSAKPRGMTLAVLGQYQDPSNDYQRSVLSAAGVEVRFLGAIYEKTLVQALRFHAALYLHGHQVGGTNPSLVEALGAGNAVLAHDNPFNRWVAGPSARYFSNEVELGDELDLLCAASPTILKSLGAESRKRHAEAFTWDRVLSQYEELLNRWAGIPQSLGVAATSSPITAEPAS